MKRSARRLPGKYHEASCPNFDVVAKALQPILDKLKWEKNEVILDHGCHHGKQALKLLLPIVEKYKGTLYALHDCETTIKFAHKTYGHPKINYILGDLNMPEGTLGDLRFNKIFSFHSLYTTPNYKTAIKSMYDHLVPGGQGILMIPTGSHIFELNTKLHEDEKWKSYHKQEEQLSWPAPDYVGEAAEQNLREAFTSAGFEIKELEFFNKSYIFENPRQMIDYKISLNSFAGHLSGERRNELEEVVYKYVLETPTETYTPGPNSAKEQYVYPFVCAHALVQKPE